MMTFDEKIEWLFENSYDVHSYDEKSKRELHEMKKARQDYYNRMKRRARNTALYWQEEFAEKSMSWGELAEAQSYFEKLGKKYGLLAEFRENGIC